MKIFAVGRKGRDYLRRELGQPDRRRHQLCRQNAGSTSPTPQDIADARHRDAGGRRVRRLRRSIYNRFHSVISQVVTEQQLIPAPLPPRRRRPTTGGGAIYEFEPDEETILARLLPQNLAIQIYRALLESAAGEHGARMTAMDNATRNAGDMIKRLTPELQPRAPGEHHQGTDRDHLRRRSALIRIRLDTDKGARLMASNNRRARHPGSRAPSWTCSSTANCRSS